MAAQSMILHCQPQIKANQCQQLMFAYLQFEFTTISYFYQTTWGHIPQDSIFHSHHHQNLKSPIQQWFENGYFMLKRLRLKPLFCSHYLQYGIYSSHSFSATLHLISLALLDTIIQTICTDTWFRWLAALILFLWVRFWEQGLKDMENHFIYKNYFMPKLFLLFTIPTSSWHRHTDCPQSHIKLS
jgi:hypothetical protein